MSKRLALAHGQLVNELELLIDIATDQDVKITYEYTIIKSALLVLEYLEDNTEIPDNLIHSLIDDVRTMI